MPTTAGAAGPTNAAKASLKPPVLIPFKYNHGINSLMFFVFRKYGGKIFEVNFSASSHVSNLERHPSLCNVRLKENG